LAACIASACGGAGAFAAPQDNAEPAGDAAVARVLAQLAENPDSPPPRLPAETLFVRLLMRVASDGSPLGTPVYLADSEGERRLEEARKSVTGPRKEPPRFWLLSLDQRGTVQHWVAVSSTLSVLAENVPDPNTGRIEPEIATARQGVITARVPFLRGGAARLLPPQPPHSVAPPRPLAIIPFGDVLPAPHGRAGRAK